MPAIAIIGAGPGLGAAVAHRFGSEGYDVALVARTQSKLDTLVDELQQTGITASGYTADVRDPHALTAALTSAETELGTIEVIQYSPVPQHDHLKPILDTTTDDLTDAFRFSVLGPVTAVERVLPGMRRAGRGTVLFVNGASAVRPNHKVAGTSAALAAETAYAQMLHHALADEGIHVGQLIIPGGITPGHPTHGPDVLADRLWTIHTTRDGFRDYAEPLADQ
jgi:short-subunit dehydrogenase